MEPLGIRIICGLLAVMLLAAMAVWRKRRISP
jgi:hypothetical protein